MSAEERRHLIVNDARGNQRIITPSRRVTFACVAILIALASEVLAYHSISDNLIIFLTNEPLCWSNAVANNIQLGFTGAMNVIGIFGGWLSDTYIGRHSLIMIAYVIYFLGYTSLLSATFFMPSSQKGSLVYEGGKCNSSWSYVTTTAEADEVRTTMLIFTALVLTSLAAGIIKTNLAVFGGEQARERRKVTARQFFSMYYWAINFGSLFIYGGVVFLQQKSFFEGYLMSMSFLLLSMLVFTAGIPFYNRIPAKGSNQIFKNVITMVSNAWKVKRSTPRLELPNLLDYANMENGGRFTEIQINDARSFYKACKVFLLLIPYFICYSQMSGSLYIIQGLHLRLNFTFSLYYCPDQNTEEGKGLFCNRTPTHIINGTVAANSTDIPAEMLQVFNIICVLLVLPFVHRFYRFLASRNINVFTWRRMVFGMILACLSLLSAGILETVRLRNICECGVHQQSTGYTVYAASPGFSIWWQIPQYIFFGASEVLLILTSLEYAYMAAPRNMQGTVMGMFWLTGGLGYFIGLALPALFRKVGFYKNVVTINNDRLDYALYSLAVFIFLYSIIFGIIATHSDLNLNSVIVNDQVDLETLLHSTEERERNAITNSRSENRPELHTRRSRITNYIQ